MKGVLWDMLCADKWNCRNNRLLLSVDLISSVFPEESESKKFSCCKGHLVYSLGIIFMINYRPGHSRLLCFLCLKWLTRPLIFY